MLTFLFTSAIQILCSIGLLVLIYQIFLSDIIDNKINQFKNKRTKTSNVEKISKVKLISDDIKEIEVFITDNAEYLSDDTVKSLVNRIDHIKNDNIINSDTLLKKRIDALNPILETEAAPEVVKRSAQKKVSK